MTLPFMSPPLFEGAQGIAPPKRSTIFRKDRSAFGRTYTDLEVGDLIIVVAFKRGSYVAPDLPVDFTQFSSAGQYVDGAGNDFAYRAGYKVADSTTEVAGPWTGADITCSVVYGGATGIGNTNINYDYSATGEYGPLILSASDRSSHVVSFSILASDNPGGSLNPPGYEWVHGEYYPALEMMASIYDTLPYEMLETKVGVRTAPGSSPGTITFNSAFPWLSVRVELLGGLIEA